MRVILFLLLLQTVVGFLDIIPVFQNKRAKSVELHGGNILVREELGETFSNFGVAKVYENQGGGVIVNIGNIYAQDTRQMILTTDVVVHLNTNGYINIFKKRDVRVSMDWQPFTSDDYGSILLKSECVLCGPTLADCKVLAETFCTDTEDDCYITAYDDGTFAITDTEDDYYFDDGTEGSPNGYTIEWANVTTISETSYYDPTPNPGMDAMFHKVGTTNHDIKSTARMSVVDSYSDTNGNDQPFRLIVADPVADGSYSPTIALYQPNMTETGDADAKGYIQQWSGAAWGIKGKEDWLVVCTDNEVGGVKHPALRIHKWNGTAYEQETIADVDNFVTKFNTGTDQLCKGGVEHNMDVYIEKDDNNNDILHIFLQDMGINFNKGGVHYIIYNSVDQAYTFVQTISGVESNEQLGKQVHASENYGSPYLLLSAPTHSGRNDGGWRLYQMNPQKLFEEIDSHINQALITTSHEIGVDIDLDGDVMAVSGNVDDLFSTGFNFGSKVYTILEDTSGQSQCQSNQFFSGESCMPCMVLKTKYQNYDCCKMQQTSASKLDCEMNNVPCKLCTHLWTEWHHTCNSCNQTNGDTCESNQDCQSKDCRGGSCCSPFLNDANCAECSANGFCASCATNYNYNYTTNKCQEITTTPDGDSCAANSDCTSGYCLTNCCTNEQNYNGCASCDTSGNCAACETNKTWTAGIGCQ